MLAKILKSIDVFGQPIQLKLNGQSKHQTIIGGIASITTIAIVFLFFYSQIMGFIQKETLTVTQMNEFQEQPELIMLNDYILAIGFDDSLYENRFNISIVQNTIINQTVIKQVSLELEQCNLTNIQNNKQFKLKSHKISQYLCLKMNQTLIIGSQDEENYEFQLIVSKCLYNSSICNITQNIETTQNVQLIFLNYVVNPMETKESQFIQEFFDDIYQLQFVPNTFTKQQMLYLTQTDITNDQSLFPYNDVDQLKIYQIDFRDSKEIIGIEDDVYAKFIFKKNQLKYKIDRSCEKITDLLARLGGFLKISIFILGFAIQIYNRLEVYIILANKIYEFSFQTIKQREFQEGQLNLLSEALQTKVNKFQDNETQQMPISRINQKQNSIKLRSCSITLQPLNFNNQDIEHIELPLSTQRKSEKTKEEEGKQITTNIIENHAILAKRLNCQNGLEYFQKQINQIINRSQSLKITFQLLINQCFCQCLFKKNINVILYQKAMKQISNHLDVFYILSKLDELSKLKQILLTNSQLQLFNFTPKQLIAPDNKVLRFNRHFLEEKARTRQNTFSGDNSINSISKKQIITQQSKLDNDENLIYEKIYNSYDNILQQCEGETSLEMHNINEELIKKLGKEIQTLFKVSKILDYQQLEQNRQQRKMKTRRNAQLNKQIEVTNVMQQFYQS